MKFITNVKPFKTAVGLAVVKSNVSKFSTKSYLAQISIDGNELKINTESTAVLSEASVKGKGDGSSAVILVDCLLLLDLIGTIGANIPTIELEITDSALAIHYGKSTFNIPQMVDAGEMRLASPYIPTDSDMEKSDEIDVSGWKKIKDYQMFAKATSFALPQYTYVWCGDCGDVVVGDLQNSIFTHSEFGQLDTNCLLSDTIINLMMSLPPEARIVSHEDYFVISVSTDSYNYIAQFTPTYESEETGMYPANDIMNMMCVSDDDGISVEVADILTALNQSNILTSKTSSNRNSVIEFTVGKDSIRLKDDNIDCNIAGAGGPEKPYTLIFKPGLLKNVISNCPDNIIMISPIVDTENNDISGVVISCKDLDMMIGAYDEQ